MKADIHPNTFPAVFVDTSCGAEFIASTTMDSKKERVIKGVPHKVVLMEISSASHPFYTGKQILVDTAKRAEKFQDKVTKSAGVAAVRKGKKAKKAKAEAKKKAKIEAEKTRTEERKEKTEVK